MPATLSSILLIMALQAQTDTSLIIGCPSFRHEGNIPEKYTCEGDNTNPSLNIGNIPNATKTLALIMEDPDAPAGTFYHWVAWNIKPTDTIRENSSPGSEGVNSKGKKGYTGPCPPTGTHRYFFRIYALDISLDLPENTDRDILLNAMQGHIIAEGELMGMYEKMRR